MAKVQAWKTAPLLSAVDHRGGRQVEEVSASTIQGQPSHCIAQWRLRLEYKFVVDEGSGLRLYAGDLDKMTSVAVKTTGGFDDERDKAHK